MVVESDIKLFAELERHDRIKLLSDIADNLHFSSVVAKDDANILRQELEGLAKALNGELTVLVENESKVESYLNEAVRLLGQFERQHPNSKQSH